MPKINIESDATTLAAAALSSLTVLIADLARRGAVDVQTVSHLALVLRAAAEKTQAKESQDLVRLLQKLLSGKTEH